MVPADLLGQLAQLRQADTEALEITALLASRFFQFATPRSFRFSFRSATTWVFVMAIVFSILESPFDLDDPFDSSGNGLGLRQSRPVFML